MGHDVRTHMKHYRQWIDDQDMEKEVDAANMALEATLSKRQQQMQALHEGRIELVGGEPKPEVTP